MQQMAAADEKLERIKIKLAAQHQSKAEATEGEEKKYESSPERMDGVSPSARAIYSDRLRQERLQMDDEINQEGLNERQEDDEAVEII